jgi:hypothetical protein
MIFKVTKDSIVSVNGLPTSTFDIIIEQNGEKCVFTTKIEKVEMYRLMLQSEAKKDGL